MAALTLDGSLRLVKSLARQNAPAGEEGSYEELGAEWIAGVFSSVLKDDERVEIWSAVVPQSDVLPTVRAYEHARFDLRTATAQYVNQMPWLHCSAFNWLLANLLLHAEVAATSKAWGYAGRWKGRGGNWLLLLRALISLIVWGIWLVILGALVLAELPWIAGLWVGLTAVRLVLSWRHKMRRNLLMSSMIDAYHSTNSMSLSWNIVWDALTKSRDLGAVWDQELYQLVETLKAKS